MTKRRVAGLVLAVLGVLAIVGSFVWRSVAVPALVRYPTDLDVTPVYEGTVTVFLDPETVAPLDEPLEVPLTVTRHIEALGDESSTDLVVVRETLTLSAPGLFESAVQEHQYVMDRRDMVNVDDPRAWAFSEDNPVNREGTYRLQFPLDTTAEPHTIYKNEIDATYVAEPGANEEIEGFDTIGFTAEAEPQPVTPAYLTALDEIVPLPRELTAEQLAPILATAGIDLQALLPALLPTLSAEDRDALVALAGAPVPLEYLDGFSGGDFVEPKTGGIVEVRDVTETIYAVPAPEVSEALKAILDRYPDVPEAAAASEALAGLAANPIPVFENSFTQTPESIADIADEVRDQRDRIRLAEDTVPLVLLIGGIVLTVAGVLLWVFGRRRPAAPAEPVPEPEPSPEPAP